MKAAKLIDSRKIIIEEVQQPYLSEYEVRISVKFCGICGSDIAAYLGLHPFIKPPIILGHEVVGVVKEVGRAVEGFEIGDRVTIEPLITCGKCYNCRSGAYNRCEEIKVVGCQLDGGFSEYLKINSSRVHKLPDNISFEIGTLIEPMAVSIHALKRGKLSIGENVVIIGDGTIGLLIAMLSELNGFNTTLIGISDNKLRFAKEVLGIRQVINSEKEDPVRILKEVCENSGADLVFECVGHTPLTIKQAIQIVKRGGRIVIIGVFHESVPVDIGYIQDKEMELLGTLVYTFRDFRTAIKIITEKNLEEKLSKFITRIYPLEKTNEAFRYILENRNEVIKILLKIQD